MKLKSTQVYLTEAEHAAVQREANRLGCSMTAVIRNLVDRYLLDAGTVTDLSDLAGSLRTTRETDIATEKDSLLYENLLDDLRRHERAVRVAES